MTQEFKFGDLVRVADDDKGFLGWCGVVVGINECAETLDIVLGPEQPSECLLMESVVLIPHPDTARLDWLQSNLADVCCYPSQNAGEDWIWACIDSGDHSRAAGVREAIDQAMQGDWA